MLIFDDIIQRLSDSYTFNIAPDRVTRLAKAAVDAAYRDISPRMWSYLRKTTQINTSDPYSTGTVDYVASTRTMTLTGGAWPSNAASCLLLIDRNVYAIQSRTSGTVLVLQDGRCPVTDLNDSEYTLVQTDYLLPRDFAELRGLTQIQRLWILRYIPPEQMLSYTQIWYNPSQSWYYTILGAPDGRMVVRFLPAPSMAVTYDLLYQARPRLRTLGAAYSAGTIAATSGGATVTLSGGSFPAGITEGCVLRIGNTTTPTAKWGDNPWVEEHVVLSRTDATHLELKTAVSATVTTARYLTDDPVDIDEMSMSTLFDRLCEARLLRMHPGASLDERTAADQVAVMALAQAIAADERVGQSILVGPPLMSLNDALVGYAMSGTTT